MEEFLEIKPEDLNKDHKDLMIRYYKEYINKYINNIDLYQILKYFDKYLEDNYIIYFMKSINDKIICRIVNNNFSKRIYDIAIKYNHCSKQIIYGYVLLYAKDDKEEISSLTNIIKLFHNKENFENILIEACFNKGISHSDIIEICSKYKLYKFIKECCVYF